MRLPALGEHILPYIDELGLPLDGANEADNKAMRVSPSGRSHLGYVQKAIGFVLAFGRPIELTIRTVVSRRNAEALAALGDLIARIDWPQLRWKLYRFVPIGYGASVWPDFWIEQNCFDELVAQVRHAHPHLHIDTLDHAERGGRYLHIMPNGDAMTPTAQHEVIALGNAFADFDGMLAALAGRIEPDHNSKHGQPLSSLAMYR